MTKTIAFHLQKGGVGKTTISGTLACQSALSGIKTLLIDLDPQGNSSSWFCTENPKWELSDVVQGKCFPQEAIVEVQQVPNLYILPTFGVGGTLKLYSETKLADEPFVIQDLINEFKGIYDHVILDLSPGLGRLERSALIASDEVITPMTPEAFSLNGLEIFIDELSRLRKNFRAKIAHNKVVINSYDNRIKQHRDIYEAASAGNFKIFQIPVDPVFRKSQEKKIAPQLFKENNKGLKDKTKSVFEDMEEEIWS